MSTNNFIRKLIQRIGFDLHRYRPSTNKLNWFQNFNIQTVIDVGANTGQFAKEIREILCDAQIYSFEPLKECFDKLKEHEQADNKFKSFHFALGNKNEKIIINKSAYSLSSSLLPMSDIHKNEFPHTKNSTPEEIEVKRMDEVFEKMILEKEILIKVDTQGYEGKVIAGGQETFSKAKVLIIENSFVTLYDAQSLFANIYASLISMGFTYRGALHQKTSTTTGEILFEDSIFIRQ